MQQSYIKTWDKGTNMDNNLLNKIVFGRHSRLKVSGHGTGRTGLDRTRLTADWACLDNTLGLVELIND